MNNTPVAAFWLPLIFVCATTHLWAHDSDGPSDFSAQYRAARRLEVDRDNPATIQKKLQSFVQLLPIAPTPDVECELRLRIVAALTMLGDPESINQAMDVLHSGFPSSAATDPATHAAYVRRYVALALSTRSRSQKLDDAIQLLGKLASTSQSPASRIMFHVLAAQHHEQNGDVDNAADELLKGMTIGTDYFKSIKNAEPTDSDFEARTAIDKLQTEVVGLLGRDSRLGGMILDSNAIALEHFPTIEESLHYFDEIPSLQNNPNAQPVKNARPYKLLLAINGLIAAAILGGYLWRKKNTPGE